MEVVADMVQQLWMIPTVFDGQHELSREEFENSDWAAPSKSCLKIQGEELDARYATYQSIVANQSSPITWMASIARNRAIDVVRKRGEVSIEEEPAAMDVAGDNPDPLERREMTEELKRLLECVGRLEPDRQKLVLLAYYNGWSREQLAEKFSAPVNTVKTWLRRSMLDIRECLGLG